MGSSCKRFRSDWMRLRAAWLSIVRRGGKWVAGLDLVGGCEADSCQQASPSSPSQRLPRNLRAWREGRLGTKQHLERRIPSMPKPRGLTNQTLHPNLLTQPPTCTEGRASRPPPAPWCRSHPPTFALPVSRALDSRPPDESETKRKYAVFGVFFSERLPFSVFLTAEKLWRRRGSITSAGPRPLPEPSAASCVPFSQACRGINIWLQDHPSP